MSKQNKSKQKTSVVALFFFVISKGKFTKHYFEGAGRIVSKLGNGSFAQPLKLTAGGVNYSKLTAEQQKAMDTYVKSLGVPPGSPTQQGIYATPEFTGDPYPSEVLTPVEENQEPPEGWPRNPIFNAPGDVPGPPVQFGPPVEPTTVKGGEGFTGTGMPENDIFYFHPDHLGSTSYITNKNGSISQHVEYIAFGEVLFEEHSSSFSSPYLFNGKELDRETNLSYYGARYLDMKTSLWLNVDPLAEKYPNFGAYVYCYNNPLNIIDPTGMEGEENSPPFSTADAQRVRSAISYVNEVIGKRNEKIDKINNKISTLETKQNTKYSEGRQNRITNKNDKVTELRNQVTVLEEAKDKMNYLMNSANHNLSFQLGSNVGRDMGNDIQEAGNVVWGNKNTELIVNTNGSQGTLIHELSHLFDIVSLKYSFTRFAPGANVGFYNEHSEVDAYKISYSLGDNLPAPVKNGVNSINSIWFNENLRKNYSKKK